MMGGGGGGWKGCLGRTRDMEKGLRGKYGEAMRA